MGKERVIIFIDGSNYYHILKDLVDKSKKFIGFNFERFTENIIGGRNLVRVYYYTSPLDRKKDELTYTKQQQFFDKLRKIPKFELVLCRMQRVVIHGQIIYQVKEDDIHLAVDMLKLAYNDAYDTAILVSSDGDFVPAVKAVKETGRNVENIGFENKFSYHLKQECDKFRKLNKVLMESFFD